MANIGFKGVDVRQDGSLLLFRGFFQNSSGALIVSGTTTLRIYELQSDGALKTYDFSTNAFTTGTPTTALENMNYEKSTNGTIDTGIWTYALGTTTGFTAQGIYFAHTTNSGAFPTDQMREFQFGSAEGGLAVTASGTSGKSYLQGDTLFIVGHTPTLDGQNNLSVNVADWDGTTVSTSVPLAASSYPANFGTLGITSGGKVSGVALVDTLTTYTSNTPSSGDPYARLGAPAGASVSADIAAVKSSVGSPAQTSVIPANFAALGITAGGKISEVVLVDSVSGITDPWATTLPGAYTSGQAGNIVGNNLNAAVSTRSTYSGGAVASVTAPVTVGTNSDKTGYALSSAGLDSIVVETSVNPRQALSAILSACAGVLSGAGTGTIVIEGGNVVTTRITATTDSSGNRSAVTLSLPT